MRLGLPFHQMMVMDPHKPACTPRHPPRPTGSHPPAAVPSDWVCPSILDGFGLPQASSLFRGSLKPSMMPLWGHGLDHGGTKRLGLSCCQMMAMDVMAMDGSRSYFKPICRLPRQPRIAGSGAPQILTIKPCLLPGPNCSWEAFNQVQTNHA